MAEHWLARTKSCVQYKATEREANLQRFHEQQAPLAGSAFVPALQQTWKMCADMYSSGRTFTQWVFGIRNHPRIWTLPVGCLVKYLLVTPPVGLMGAERVETRVLKQIQCYDLNLRSSSTSSYLEQVFPT